MNEETEDRVPYEIAKQLKGKGFNKPCYGYFDANGHYYSVRLKDFPATNSNMSEDLVSAPTSYQVLNWLKKEHGLQLFPDYNYYDGFHYGYKWCKANGDYGVIWKDNDGESPDGSDTMEEATALVIKEALKLI